MAHRRGAHHRGSSRRQHPESRRADRCRPHAVPKGSVLVRARHRGHAGHERGGAPGVARPGHVVVVERDIGGMGRILTAYSNLDKKLGYCQGKFYLI